MTQAAETLDKALVNLFAKLKTKGNNIGAMQGIMVGEHSVKIDGKMYRAVIATDVNTEPGTYVWCQLASSDTAVVIGG